MTQATATHSSSSTILSVSASSDYQVVEGNIYFPPSSILVPNTTLVANSKHTTCPWKGLSQYYDLKLDDGKLIKDVGWSYPETKKAAENIRGFVAWDKSKISVKTEA